MRVALIAAALVVMAPAVGRAGESTVTPTALFESVGAAAGLEGVHGGRVSFADLDRNGYPDAIVDGTHIFLNVTGTAGRAGGRRFVRSEAAESALNTAGRRGADSVQVGDVNGDGCPDLFIGRMTDLSNPKFTDDGLRNEIWLGDGKGGFVRKDDAGIAAHAETTISACFVDYDGDGVLDLFVGNAYVAYGKSLEAFPSRLYRGRGDGTFEEVTEKAGLLGVAEPGGKDSRRPTYGVAHTDWNNDGRQDLLTMSYGRQWNRLWRNNGDGTFTDVGPETGFDGDEDRSGKYPDEVKKQDPERTDEPPFRANGNTFDCAVADYNGDGNMDCFLAEITHWWAGPSSDLSMLLVNLGKEQGFKFRRRPELIQRVHATPHWNQGDMHAGWLDVDNDGYLDLLIASSDYPDEQVLKLYHQKPDGSGTFEEWTDRLGFHWLNASQISLGDFDRDGATDILVGTENHRLSKEQIAAHSLDVGLFRNLAAAAAGNRFLSLRLTGGGKGKANRDAVGARVTIWTGDHRQTREVYGGLGHGGHRDDTECRFGVGKAEKVDRLEVRWPDAKNTVQTFTDVATGRFYALEQGGELRVER
jgi:hypothetical protein